MTNLFQQAIWANESSRDITKALNDTNGVVRHTAGSHPNNPANKLKESFISTGNPFADILRG